MNSSNEIAGLKSLTLLQKNSWKIFSAKLDAFCAEIGFSTKFSDSLSDFEVTAANFKAAGFSADESAALLFIVADGADDMDGIDRWIINNRRAVALLAA